MGLGLGLGIWLGDRARVSGHLGGGMLEASCGSAKRAMIAVVVRVRGKVRVRGRGEGEIAAYDFTLHFYSRVGQIAIFSHCRP